MVQLGKVTCLRISFDHEPNKAEAPEFWVDEFSTCHKNLFLIDELKILIEISSKNWQVHDQYLYYPDGLVRRSGGKCFRLDRDKADTVNRDSNLFT